MLIRRTKTRKAIEWMMDRPARVIISSFLLIMLVGTLLLMMPFVTNSGESIGFFDSLFTTVSATCVTGLIVRDTATTFNTLGRVILLILIQVGGLGLVTIYTFGVSLVKRKVNVKTRVLAQESTGSFSFAELKGLLQTIILMTMFFELLGFVLFATQFVPLYGYGDGLFKSLFMAVSAFCNAGFDVMGDTASGPYSSLTAFNGNTLIMFTTVFLIFSGSLGFHVWKDLIDYTCRKIRAFVRHDKKERTNIHMKLHTRLAFVMMVALLLVGAVLILAMEWTNQDPLSIGSFPVWEKIKAALFQSMSMRTAGMNSIDLLAMRDCTKILCAVLMFIGAGAGSTGGGIKVQVFALLLYSIRSDFAGNPEVVIKNHRVSRTTVQRALTIFTLGICVVVVLACVLSVTERSLLAAGKFTFVDLIFESASAFGTVGVTSASTPQFSFWGHLFIIPVMFLGRIGPITFAMGMMLKDKKNVKSVYPEAKIHLG
ncbi:MAG: Trk family potassium uptake protein [Clostridiales bacterium]|nr:Trk family potassium uptake protein [Clostridiales bacterium]